MSLKAPHRLTTARLGLEKLLPVAEAEIMRILWAAREPLNVRAVHDIVLTQRKVAYTTVMTTCNRLAEKGLLDRKEPEHGYGYVYSPAIGEREFVSCAIADILDAVVRDYPSALALYLDTRREMAA